ncbi:MAG: MerC domain-containing protein [Maricaulaceae bacterium]|nr:MerC domain-containing protein [Maricaulaceae bacterium]
MTAPHTPPAETPRLFDASAITLSGLCLVHCLALPVLAAFSPLLALLAGAEWIHAAFVVLAAPVSALALARHFRHGGRRPWGLAALAAAGVAMLALGVLGWPQHEWETPLTVAGALTLAGVHIWNWRTRARRG